MNQKEYSVKIFWMNPFTYLAVFTVLVCEWGFITWFQPPFSIMVGVLATGIIVFAAWALIFFKFGSFQQRYSSLPYELERKELETLLKSAAAPFKKPALDLLDLLSNTRQEFQSQIFQQELDSMVSNLRDLSRNHVQLFSRVHQFGTEAQQKKMALILQQQAQSVKNSLEALRSFSGSLTLLDAHPDDHTKMGSNLKAINQELQNVIQEVL
ncbi:hypothetical protein CSB45_09415 [candidate division KSB3 bacterium]|uniref:Uncharacterized protein n=1 Tax=candidate division KSB3 bacterium TaxID=2044937 RepID=A0A2G6E490_9BACT|nr:MAG: hypothetical protein CSB45_09415 [candidate division KSB3 bacterium]PIE29457.1 MAG: hypothetical protein CSA57_08660 [candidate division KSB3 bacterium]